MTLNRRCVLQHAAGIAALGAFPTVGAGASLGGSTAVYVNVRDHGAKGDGKTIDTRAIDRAIVWAAERGGGTIYFPPGIYASYTIHLRSGITLFLDRGAVLLAASVPMEGTTTGGYDLAEPQNPAIERFQDYGHNHWRNSLIYGENLHDIGIIGDGMIWGKGLSRGHDFDTDRPKAALPGVGNKAIALKLCRNVHLRDFSILEGGHFALLATGVDNLVIDNLIVDTNRDGFDIDCCRNVRVSNCTVNSPYDDAIVPKSSFALGYVRPTENVTITNCQVSGSYAVGSLLDGTYRQAPRNQTTWRVGRIKCGTESNGGFKNITISNCVFDQCWGLALETVDGAVLEDIAVSNITMRGCLSAPMFLRLGRRMRGPQGSEIGSLRRILIDNVTCQNASLYPSIIAGSVDHPVEDVKISNVFIEQTGGGDTTLAAVDPPGEETSYPEPDRFGQLPATGFFIRDARNIELSHVEIRTRAPDARPTHWLKRVEDFFGEALTGPVGSTQFELQDVRNLKLFACRGIADRQIAQVGSLRF